MGKEGLENDDDSTKTAITDIVSPKHDIHMDFLERITKFHGKKYSRQYDFKIILEATQESPEVYLAQCFYVFFKKMIAVDKKKLLSRGKKAPTRNQ